MTPEEAADAAQDWKGMDGATAFLLIERHADGWDEVQQMMDAWLRANVAAAVLSEREECARVCEAWAKDHAEAASSPGDECDYNNCDFMAAAEDCAAAIDASHGIGKP